MPIKRTYQKNGKTINQYFGRITIDGKRYEKKFSSKQAAKEWEVLARKKYAELSPTSTQKDYSLHSLLTLNIQTCRARGMDDKSIKEKILVAKEVLKHIKPDAMVGNISYRQIEEFLNHIAVTRSGYRANRFRGHLLQAYRWGIKALNLPAPCPWEVDRYKTVKTPRYVPPLEDFVKVIETAGGDRYNLLLAFFYTAARKEEILSLTWEDVDFINNTVRLWTSKRKGGREFNPIPMSAPLKQLLQEQYADTGACEYVFINDKTGTRYTSLTKFMPQLCQSAGVKEFGFHSIRHLAASIMDNGNMTLADIQSILRHQKADTTSRYLHSMKGRAAIGQQLDNVLVLPIKKNSPAAVTVESLKKVNGEVNELHSKHANQA